MTRIVVSAGGLWIVSGPGTEDTNFRVCALQDPEADELLGSIDQQRRMASWHLVEEGHVYSAGERQLLYSGSCQGAVLSLPSLKPSLERRSVPTLGWHETES